MGAKFAFALLVAALSVAACSRGPGVEQRVLQDVTTKTIQPMHADFVAATLALDDAATTFCVTPTAASRETARAAWRVAMRDWQRLQVVSFGPVAIDNQAWKVQFWPDRNNLVARQLESLLASDDALTAERLESASVVMQGLTAAEYLLFDADGGDLSRYADAQVEASRRCRLLELIAVHTFAVAGHLQRGWAAGENNHAAVFTAPAADNPDYPTPADALAALLDSVLAGIETARNDKLAEPLGLRNDLGIAQPYAVEAWRSRSSMSLLLATVEGASRLYFAGQRSGTSFGVDDLLRARDFDALADKIDKAFRRVSATAPRDVDLFDAVNNTTQVDALREYHEALTSLAGLLKNELPAALGITLGFNDKDGD